jgi:hypothetical protein
MAAGPVELPASAVAALANFGMKVAPENILGLYAVVMEEARRLELSLVNFQMRHQVVPKLGGDPVSAPAAAGFREVTSELLVNCRRTIKELQDVANGPGSRRKGLRQLGGPDQGVVRSEQGPVHTHTALCTALALSACTSPTATPTSAPPPPAPSLPPRPLEMRLDGIDPCALLTAAQRSTLGVGPGQASTTSPSDSTVQGAACLWLTVEQHPAEGYTATAVLNQGAEVALRTRDIIE